MGKVEVKSQSMQRLGFVPMVGTKSLGRELGSGQRVTGV